MIILLIPLVVYIYCLCPTVFVGDAGDFLTASYTLGVPHPPGYPTYTMLGYLFMQLPIHGGLSEPAYRMNLMSAVAAWAACVFMFLFLRRILRTEWAALAGALALAFSGQFWEHAEIAEVYTMQSMFITLLFYISVLYVQEKKLLWAYLLAFFMGLALTHHYAVLLFYPGIFIFIGMNGGLKLGLKTWLIAVLLAIIGLTPYAYLPLVKYKTPLGEVAFVKSTEEAEMLPRNVVAARETPLEYFFYYVSRHFYSMGRKYTHTPDVLTERTTTPMVFRKFLQVTERDFGIPLSIAALLGWLAAIISLKRKRDSVTVKPHQIPKAAFVPPALGYVFYFLIVHFFPSGDILAAPMANLDVVVPPLLIPLQVSLAAIIALGFDFALRMIAQYVKSQGIENLNESTKFKTFAGLLMIATYMLISVNAVTNWESGNKSDSVISYNYALNVLDSCDPDSILLTTGDETFLFWYVQNCEPSDDPKDPRPGYRKDVWATNWIHNLETLKLLTDESQAMRVVAENFIINSSYYFEGSDYYGFRPVNSTFVAGTFAQSELIMSLDVVLNGITYLFRIPGEIPDLSEKEVRQTGDLGPVAEGAESLMVIDYYDARPFRHYRMGGLPRFEMIDESGDLFSMDAIGDYIVVNLEPQEKEVLARYQDSLYRFGIAALLEGTEESKNDAVGYLYFCVSLDPSNFFGWKELGDAFFAKNELIKSRQAYLEVENIFIQKGDVPPVLVAGALASVAHIDLILGDTTSARNYANKALIFRQDEPLARRVLEEIERLRERTDEEMTDKQEETDEIEESAMPEESID